MEGGGDDTPISERFIIETARGGSGSEGSIAFFFGVGTQTRTCSRHGLRGKESGWDRGGRGDNEGGRRVRRSCDTSTRGTTSIAATTLHARRVYTQMG